MDFIIQLAKKPNISFIPERIKEIAQVNTMYFLNPFLILIFDVV
jgi:hypothetical protein